MMNKILALSLALVAAGIIASVATAHGESPPVADTAKDKVGAVTIYRPLGCGCCDTYAKYLRERGFAVSVVNDSDFVTRLSPPVCRSRASAAILR